MKTTYDLPEEELAEAMRPTQARTRAEAVSLAVAGFNRRKPPALLASRRGTFTAPMTRDLRARREKD